MFMKNGALPNGLDPGDKQPGPGTDLMEKLMADWSWRPTVNEWPRGLRRSVAEAYAVDPGYVYTKLAVLAWETCRRFSRVAPALRPWSFPAYAGPVARPPRIGPNVG